MWGNFQCKTCQDAILKFFCIFNFFSFRLQNVEIPTSLALLFTLESIELPHRVSECLMTMLFWTMSLALKPEGLIPTSFYLAARELLMEKFIMCTMMMFKKTRRGNVCVCWIKGTCERWKREMIRPFCPFSSTSFQVVQQHNWKLISVLLMVQKKWFPVSELFHLMARHRVED